MMIKICVDIGMTVALLFLMTYELVVLVLSCMVGSLVSGVILSRHALSFLPISGGRSFARNLHMISAYWGFVWMSLHLGLHWSIMLCSGRRFLQLIRTLAET